MTVFSGVVAILSPKFVTQFLKNGGHGDVLAKVAADYGVTCMRTAEDICTVHGEWSAMNKVYTFLQEAEHSVNLPNLKALSENSINSNFEDNFDENDCSESNRSLPNLGEGDLQIVATWGNCTDGEIYNMQENEPEVDAEDDYDYSLKPMNVSPRKRKKYVKVSKNIKNKVVKKELTNHIDEIIESKDVGGDPNSTAKEEFNCMQCNKSFFEEKSLNVHQFVYHNKEINLNNIVCPYCSKALLSKNGLEEHMFNHVGARPFACDICSDSFNHRKSLRRHMETHKGIKHFVCTDCGQGFARKDTLENHKNMGNPSQEPKAVCENCQIKFYNLSCFRKHINDTGHSGNKSEPTQSDSLNAVKTHNSSTFNKCNAPSPNLKSWEEKLAAHNAVISQNKSPSKVPCAFCNGWFSNVSYYKKHVKRKHPELLTSLSDNNTDSPGKDLLETSLNQVNVTEIMPKLEPFSPIQSADTSQSEAILNDKYGQIKYFLEKKDKSSKNSRNSFELLSEILEENKNSNILSHVKSEPEISLSNNSDKDFDLNKEMPSIDIKPDLKSLDHNNELLSIDIKPDLKTWDETNSFTDEYTQIS